MDDAHDLLMILYIVLAYQVTLSRPVGTCASMRCDQSGHLFENDICHNCCDRFVESLSDKHHLMYIAFNETFAFLPQQTLTRISREFRAYLDRILVSSEAYTSRYSDDISNDAEPNED